MGLDMYLNANRTFYGDWNNGKRTPPAIREPLANTVNLPPPSDNLGYIELALEAVYWRKANQIHAWFVKNVQEGEDDCRSYDVSAGQLRELRDTCKRVLDSCKLVDGQVVNGYTFENSEMAPIIEEGQTIEDPLLAAELLPVQSGFFFGGTGYDQWYYRNVLETHDKLTKLLEWYDADKGDDQYSDWSFTYQSSW